MDTPTDAVAEKMHNVLDTITKHKVKVIAGVVSIAVFAGAFFGYKYYRNSIQTSAYKDFMGSLKYYDAPVKKGEVTSIEKDSIVFGTEEEKWNKVADVFKRGYEKNRRSTFAPMFKAFVSEALLNNGKREEAIKELQTALGEMKEQKVKQAYSLKLSLMKLDGTDKKVQDEGLNTLKEMAYDNQNPLHGLALYHLGLHSWVNSDFHQAKSYWQQFIVKFGNQRTLDKEVNLVKSKLDLIAV